MKSRSRVLQLKLNTCALTFQMSMQKYLPLIFLSCVRNSIGSHAFWQKKETKIVIVDYIKYELHCIKMNQIKVYRRLPRH